MRHNKIITIINLIVISQLVTVFFLYRTDWASSHLPPISLPFLVLLTLLSTITATVAFFAVHRRYRTLRAVEANLEKIAPIDAPEESLTHIEPVPVGSNITSAGKGWNKLLGAIDQIQNKVQTTQSEKSMGQFLCSYDSQRLLVLIDSLPDGIILTDTTGSVTLANRSCEGLIGKPLSEFIGQNILDIFEDPQARQHLEYALNAKSSLPDNHLEITIGSGSGKTVLCLYCHRLTHNSENSDIFLVIRDITQQKISEGSRDEFVAHVSHELRGPLTNIRAYAETLLSDMVLDAVTQKEAFNVINEETSRMIRLVNDVLDISRMETGSLVLEKNEVVLDRLVQNCVNDIKASAAGKKITIQTNYHPKLPNLYADREKMTVVINNILTNAIKYTADGGTVFIETNIDDNFVYIKVADTGYGIAPDDIDKIFEKFYRVNRKETANITGTGLGLTISNEIVTLHGGTIDVSSELDNGTEVMIKLPITITGPVLGPANS